METLFKIDEVKKIVREWKKQGFSVGFVPTMGALHEGHASLIKKARENSDKVIVSIFVNPTQFGPNEDFDKYPRTLEVDKVICQNCGADVVFAPSAVEMYPVLNQNNDDKKELITNKHLTMVIAPKSFSTELCGATRPGHFDGVVTVITKFFNVIQPDKAFFGQKDAQQLIIIKKMCSDLNFETEIIPCPIVRGDDGLALSSRNAYLSDEERKKATSLYRVLKKAKACYNSKKTRCFEEIKSESLKELHEDVELEYLEAYGFEHFERQKLISGKTLIAIAARIKNVRLIDNIIIED